jgi:hypothetical protein
MSKRKNRLGLFGLLAVTALGMMAFASSALGAIPVFLVNGAPPSAALDVTATGVQEGRGTLEIPSLNTEINCEEVEVSGGLMANSTDAKVAKLLYKQCTTLEINAPLAEIATCVVSDAHTGNPNTTHVTALNPLLLPVEFAAGHFGILAENIHVFINFLAGKGCTLPLKTEVKGEVCFLIEPTTNETTEPLIKTDLTIQKSCPKRIVLEGLEPNPAGGTFEDKLLYGAQEAFIIGSAKLKLTGEHTGLKLGVSLF